MATRHEHGIFYGPGTELAGSLIVILPDVAAVGLWMGQCANEEERAKYEVRTRSVTTTPWKV